MLLSIFVLETNQLIRSHFRNRTNIGKLFDFVTKNEKMGCFRVYGVRLVYILYMLNFSIHFPRKNALSDLSFAV